MLTRLGREQFLAAAQVGSKGSRRSPPRRWGCNPPRSAPPPSPRRRPAPPCTAPASPRRAVLFLRRRQRPRPALQPVRHASGRASGGVSGGASGGGASGGASGRHAVEQRQHRQLSFVGPWFCLPSSAARLGAKLCTLPLSNMRWRLFLSLPPPPLILNESTTRLASAISFRGGAAFEPCRWTSLRSWTRGGG